jgi:hypothetical protein
MYLPRFLELKLTSKHSGSLKPLLEGSIVEVARRKGSGDRYQSLA